MKSMIGMDDEALAAATKERVTTTKRDAVNSALRDIAGRRGRAAAILEGPNALGVGEDIDDVDIMGSACR